MTESKELLPEPKSLGEANAIAEALSKSELLPKQFVGKPSNVLIAMMWCKSIGMPLVQGINSIAVVNGRPSMYGDALKGLVFASGLCEDFKETFDAQSNIAVCSIKRKGIPTPIVAAFSFADAQKAHLIGKPGPWQQFPKRMCQMRARAFAIRDAFPDLLMGFAVREEVEDVPADDVVEAAPAAPVQEVKRPRRKSAKSAPAVDQAPAAPALENSPSPTLAEIAPAAAAPVAQPAPVQVRPAVEPEPDVPPPVAEEIPLEEPEAAPDPAAWLARIDAAESYAEVVELWKSAPKEIRPALKEACEKRTAEIKAEAAAAAPAV